MFIPNITAAPASAPLIDIVDDGKIVPGGRFRLPGKTRTRVADRGIVVLGGGFRNAVPRVADRGTVVLGGGFRLIRGA